MFVYLLGLSLEFSYRIISYLDKVGSYLLTMHASVLVERERERKFVSMDISTKVVLSY